MNENYTAMCQFVNDGQSGLYLNDMFDDMDLYPT
jgi:hypothetical protein